MKEKLSREVIAMRIAREFFDGAVVNLGIGIPTLVSSFVPEGMQIIYHTENGSMGFGPVVSQDELDEKADIDFINAGGQYLLPKPGMCFFDHATSFAIIRGGRVDFSDFLLGFIDELGLEKPVLVGHSFGARICMDAALRNQGKVGKLVLIDASGLGKVSGFGTALLTVFWGLRKLFRRPQPYPKFLVRDGDDFNHIGVDNLNKLSVPTLLVWKRHDPYLPLALARRAEALIPRARLVVLPGYGHAPHEQNRKAFNHLLLDYLDHD